MRPGDADAGQRVAEWRAAFDRSFAEPAVARAEDLRDYLGIRVAGQALALSLDELAGLSPWREPTPYPVMSEHLLGLIGVAGRTGGVLPLFDLRGLLGQGRAAAPAWIVQLKNAPLALAFEGFDGQWRLAPQERVVQPGPPAAALLGDTVRCGELLRPLIDLVAVLRRLEADHSSSTGD